MGGSMIVWKINDVRAKDGLITGCHYSVTLSDDKNSVSTEGHWDFGNPVMNTPFEQVTEQMVVEWVKADAIQYGENVIESNLAKQLEALEQPKVLPPWAAQVFTVGDK
jgi:hypothetical protein